MICSFLLVCVSIWTGLWAIPKDMAFRAAEACGVANTTRFLCVSLEDVPSRGDATCATLRKEVAQRARIVDVMCAGREDNILYPDSTLVKYDDDPSTIYVAFSGWKSSEDTWALLSLRSALLKDIGLDERYGHGGLAARYESLRDNLLGRVTQNREGVAALVFCGHCMGAGLASYAYEDFKQNVPGIESYVIALAPIISVLPPRMEDDDNASYFWFDDDLWRGCAEALDRVVRRSPIGQKNILVGDRVSWWKTYRLKRYIKALDPRSKKDD